DASGVPVLPALPESGPVLGDPPVSASPLALEPAILIAPLPPWALPPLLLCEPPLDDVPPPPLLAPPDSPASGPPLLPPWPSEKPLWSEPQPQRKRVEM